VDGTGEAPEAEEADLTRRRPEGLAVPRKER